MTVQISAKIDADYKPMFYHTCERIGIAPSTAINIFIKRMAMLDALPFDINEKIEVPNDITLAAFAEAEEMIKTGSGKSFLTLSEMRKAMAEDDEGDI